MQYKLFRVTLTGNLHFYGKNKAECCSPRIRQATWYDLAIVSDMRILKRGCETY